MSDSTLLIERFGFTVHVTLNRPECRNAMSLFMLTELDALFDSLQDDRSVRAVVIRGCNGHFCAGGDIKDMANARAKAMAATSDATSSFYELNRAFGRVMLRANELPQVLITVLEGAVLGGGFGLACVSDVGIAAHNAQFGMPETSLGVIPAQIAPFVVQRIGLTQARRLALLGERFDGAEAVRLGIAHYLAQDAGDIEKLLNAVLNKGRGFRCRFLPNCWWPIAVRSPPASCAPRRKWGIAPWRSTATPMPTPSTSRRRMKPCTSVPPPWGNPISTSPPSLPPRKKPAPTRFNPAMVFCRKTPPSRKPAPTTTSCSSAPR